MNIHPSDGMSVSNNPPVDDGGEGGWPAEVLVMATTDSKSADFFPPKGWGVVSQTGDIDYPVPSEDFFKTVRNLGNVD